MKNKCILLLLCTVLTGSLIGCQVQKNTPQEPIPTQAQEPPASPSQEPTVSLTQEPETSIEPEGDTPSDSMEEQVLLEQDGITVKAVSWDPDSASLEITAENTGDKDCMIQLFATSVNNYMMEPTFSLNLASASQGTANAVFIPEFLTECGIRDVAQIQTRFVLLDALSFETRYTSDPVTISVGGSLEEQLYDESGEVIRDQSGLKLVSKGIQDDPVFGKQWKVYIANDTGEDIKIESTAAVLNDIPIDVLLSVSVPSGKKAIGSMTIFQEDLDKNQIREISSLKTDLHILDPATFEVKSTVSDIQLSFDAS